MAKLGYIAFAADIYGKGIRASTPDEAGKLSGILTPDQRKQMREMPMDEMQLATRLEQLRSLEMVQRVADSLTPEEQELVTGRMPDGSLRDLTAADCNKALDDLA